MRVASRQRAALSSSLALMFGVNLVTAAETDTVTSLRVGALYSDNICLLNSGESDQWVGTLTPSTSISRDGGRSNLSLFASVKLNTLELSSPNCGVQGDNKRGIAPSLRLVSDTTLFRDLLFLDVGMWANQNIVNPFGVSGSDNINGRDNSNTTFRYNVSPYVFRRLGKATDFLLRYSRDESYNSRDEVQDSESDAVLFRVGQNPELSQFSLGLTGRWSEVTYLASSRRSETTSELSSAEFNAAYQVGRKWQINGYVGEEWNDFVSSSQEIDGTYWDLGVLWTPSPRISIGAGVGDRFFGSAPRFNVRYRHKRSVVQADYSRTLTYQRNLRTSDDFFNSVDDLAELESQPDGVEAFNGAPTTNTTSPILNDALRLRFELNGRKTKLTLFGSYSEQTRAVDGFTDTFERLGIRSQHSLFRNLSAITGIAWDKRDPDIARTETVVARTSETWRLNLGIRRDLSRKSSINLDYQYSQRDGEVRRDEYTENRIELSFRYTF